MPEMLIKICGLSTPETVDAAVAAGATHVGLVHFPKSPRHVSATKAADLRARVPEHVKVVLLTVDMEPSATSEILQAVQPDVLQLHGSESAEWAAMIKNNSELEVWKALPVKDSASLEAAALYREAAHRLLYDAPHGALPGGNGLALDWRLLMGRRHVLPWGLAGGLNSGNVGDAIRYTGAPMVDTSSGVESAPGVKDVARIRAFCEAVRSAVVRA
jgi:phosphoribosylanthranilate isomerase